MVGTNHLIGQQVGGLSNSGRHQVATEGSGKSDRSLGSASSILSPEPASSSRDGTVSSVVVINASGKSADTNSDGAFYRRVASGEEALVYSRSMPRSKQSSVSSEQSKGHQPQAESAVSAPSAHGSVSGLDAADARLIEQLKSRDREVRAHEAAHAAVGGALASAPTYTYQKGPDGRRYAVGGEVQIDVSKGRTPEETLEKARVIRAAANAPAQPSAQDRQVASRAAAMALEAQAELLTSEAEAAQQQPLSDEQGEEALDAYKASLMPDSGYESAQAAEDEEARVAAEEARKKDEAEAKAEEEKKKEEREPPALLGENRRTAAEIFEEIYGSSDDSDELSQRLLGLGINEGETPSLESIVNVTV